MNDVTSVWDFLLLILAVFFFVIWLMILFSVIGDLFRDHQTSGFVKFLWCIFLIFVPFITVFVYVIVRGRGMAERTAAAQAKAQAEFADFVKTTASGAASDPASQIANAKALLDAGTIDQAEFEKLKAKALV